MMLKRLFDIVLSLILLSLFSPILIIILILVWKNDFHSPFYVAKRMARNQGTFNMIKFRSMIVNAAKSGVNSSSSDDNRITQVGKFLRKYKLDELPQLLNVFLGDMSFVGPRPQVKTDADLYTEVERKILSARPGITDLASIVFSDEGDILKGSVDPDLRYNQIIRPWKSRLALTYIEHSSLVLDIKILWYTFVNMFNRKLVLQNIRELLLKWGCDQKLVEIVKRDTELYPYPPPGTMEIVLSYSKTNDQLVSTL